MVVVQIRLEPSTLLSFRRGAQRQGGICCLLTASVPLSTNSRFLAQKTRFGMTKGEGALNGKELSSVLASTQQEQTVPDQAKYSSNQLSVHPQSTKHRRTLSEHVDRSRE